MLQNCSARTREQERLHVVQPLMNNEKLDENCRIVTHWDTAFVSVPLNVYYVLHTMSGTGIKRK